MFSALAVSGREESSTEPKITEGVASAYFLYFTPKDWQDLHQVATNFTTTIEDSDVRACERNSSYSTCVERVEKGASEAEAEREEEGERKEGEGRRKGKAERRREERRRSRRWSGTWSILGRQTVSAVL